MFDATLLGRKILERRKAQGLTQEQLGLELGVSAQSVSKWENSETAPDISLLPPLCEKLRVSSDTLLGIGGGLRIETLSLELAQKLAESSNKRESLSSTLKYLVLMGKKNHGSPFPWERGSPNYMECECKAGKLVDVRLWCSQGLACFVMGGAADNTPTSESLNQLRHLLSPVKWDIALRLTEKPMKVQELFEAGLGPDDEVKKALTEMIDAGLLKIDKQGCQLDPYTGVPLTAFIRAMCTDLQAAHTSIYFNEIP